MNITILQCQSIRIIDHVCQVFLEEVLWDLKNELLSKALDFGIDKETLYQLPIYDYVINTNKN